LESMLSGKSYYLGEDGKVLYCKESTWNQMAATLQRIGAIKTFNYTATVDNRFVGWYHSNVVITKP
jgi:hypothetical protein